MRYLFVALALLALGGCADYDDAGYTYSGYPSYSEGYGYTAPNGSGYSYYAQPTYAQPTYAQPTPYEYYARPAPYGAENCGTSYESEACSAW